MPKKNIQKEMKSVYETLLDGPPKVRREEVYSWSALGEQLEKLNVSPEEAYKIVRAKVSGENIRFNWKMIRFTFFVWERVAEDKNGYLKPKIDTVRSVVNKRIFEDYYYGYFPNTKFSYEKEVKLLNKLIAEKSQRKYFKEGYYYYHRTSDLIPNKVLDRILWDSK